MWALRRRGTGSRSSSRRMRNRVQSAEENQLAKLPFLKNNAPRKGVVQKPRTNRADKERFAQPHPSGALAPQEFGHFGTTNFQSPCSILVKSQVGKRDSSPLLLITIHSSWRKQKSGDKSLFPTCDSLMFGEFLNVGGRQRATKNCQTSEAF